MNTIASTTARSMLLIINAIMRLAFSHMFHVSSSYESIAAKIADISFKISRRNSVAKKSTA